MGPGDGAPRERGMRSATQTADHGGQGLEEAALDPGSVPGGRTAGARSRGRTSGSGRLNQIRRGCRRGRLVGAQLRRTPGPAPRRGGDGPERETPARRVRAGMPRLVLVTRQSRTMHLAAESGRSGPWIFRLRLEPLAKEKNKQADRGKEKERTKSQGKKGHFPSNRC